MLPVAPIHLKTTQNAAPAKKAGQAGARFSVPQDVATQQAATTNAVYSMASLGAAAALFLQEVEDPLEKKKKHAKRGQDALKILEDLKNGMVLGNANEAQQIAQLNTLLTQLVQNPVEDDPYLASLMQQIEVRAAVELAKRGM